MADFLPEWNALPVGGRYRPIYKLFAGENWRQVFKDKKPVLCDSSLEAIKVAKERVKEILNTRIRVEHAHDHDGEGDADVLGVEEWRKQREESLIADRAAVFGDAPAETIFAKGGRQVQVERVGKRRRA